MPNYLGKLRLGTALVLTAATAAPSLMPPATAFAYGPPVHYDATYVIARLVGYSQDQAWKIASADVSVDTDPNTQPIRLSAPVSPDDQRVLRDFHAFGDHTLPPAAQESAKLDRQMHLWDEAVLNQNPGPFEHSDQDSNSHAGYTDVTGHFFAGTAPDMLVTDIDKSITMMERTATTLQEFAPIVGITPKNVDPSVIRAITLQLSVDSNEAEARATLEGWLGGEKVPDPAQFHFDRDGNPLDPSSFAVGTSTAAKPTLVTPNGPKSLDDLKTELQAAHYNGPLDKARQVIEAYFNAVGNQFPTPNGMKTLGEIKDELTKANYNGADDVNSLLAKYNETAAAAQVFQTVNGPKSLTDMQSELKKAGYNGPWYLSAIVAAYNRTAHTADCDNDGDSGQDESGEC